MSPLLSVPTQSWFGHSHLHACCLLVDWGFVRRCLWISPVKLALCLVWSVSFTGARTHVYLCLFVCLFTSLCAACVRLSVCGCGAKYSFFFLLLHLLQDSSKSPRPMKKFLPGNRKKERKPSDDEIQTRKSEDFLLLCGHLLGGVCLFVVVAVVVFFTFFERIMLIKWQGFRIYINLLPFM